MDNSSQRMFNWNIENYFSNSFRIKKNTIGVTVFILIISQTDWSVWLRASEMLSKNYELNLLLRKMEHHYIYKIKNYSRTM